MARAFRQELRDLLDPDKNEQLARDMMAVGDYIAGRAQQYAPRSRRPSRAGHGADSIRAEWGRMSTGERVVKISWTKRHFYMSFQEFGTVNHSGRKFMRAAIAPFRPKYLPKR